MHKKGRSVGMQNAGSKITSEAEVSSLRASLEALLGPPNRTLVRTPSGKRPLVGPLKEQQSANDKKALLYNLMGGRPVLLPLAQSMVTGLSLRKVLAVLLVTCKCTQGASQALQPY